MTNRPNIIVIMTDQQRADLSARAGYPLDTTPFLDSLARKGADFSHAFTSMPVSAAARVSMFTGRYPNSTRVRTNQNIDDAAYSRDLLDILKKLGYKLAFSGKNSSHVGKHRWDFAYDFGHVGGTGADRTADEQAFDRFLTDLRHRTSMVPTPFPVECQGPYRVVTKALQWLATVSASPFFLWLTFAEPHEPYQVCEPYFSMFPPESLPPCLAGEEALEKKGFRWQWLRKMYGTTISSFAAERERARANYHGTLRLLDDQVNRLLDFLWSRNMMENTVIVMLSDHGDFVGEYGLMRKGPDLPQCLVRIPLFFVGPIIPPRPAPLDAHVSICDVMPTLCDLLDTPLPDGVQGRSLWPLLIGQDVPPDEFRSAYVQQGVGGLSYTSTDDLDPVHEGAVNAISTFDCLNSWTQCGAMRMVSKGDWKLVFSNEGHGQLYNLKDDPAELNNLFGSPTHAQKQMELLEELLLWMLRTLDQLPLPRKRYVIKRHPKNWWTVPPPKQA